MSTRVRWENLGSQPSRRFVCGYCSSDVTSNAGYAEVVATNSLPIGSIYICHNCDCPTYIRGDKQWPGAKLGSSIDNLPQDILSLHNEIRDATAAGANTAAVLAARKVLMHIAVELGAKEGKSFATYVDHLVDNHYAPPNSKTWVDKIRQVGNEANHEIVIMGPTEAANIIKFVEMLLLFNYEFPAGDETDTESDEDA